MIFNFQKEFKNLVTEAEDMEMEIFCALTNSNVKFITGLRMLIDRVKLNAVLTEDEIKSVCCDDSRLSVMQP